MASLLRQFINEAKGLKLLEEGFDMNKSLFHGSNAKFDKYDMKADRVNRSENPSGHYSNPDKDFAQSYGPNVTEYLSKAKNTWKRGNKPNQAMADEYRKQLLDNGIYRESWLDEAIIPDFMETGRFKSVNGDIKTDVLKAGGYDSLQDGADMVHFDMDDLKKIERLPNGYIKSLAAIAAMTQTPFGDDEAQAGPLSKGAKEFKKKFDPGWYHGTPENIRSFKRDKLGTFLSPNPKEAESFGAMKTSDKWDELGLEDNMDSLKGLNMMPLSVNKGKNFDFEDADTDFGIFEGKIDPSYPNYERMFISDIKGGDWETIENPITQRILKENGYDSYHVREGGQKNLAIYDPKNIRSPHAKFDPKKANSRNILDSVAGVSALGGVTALSEEESQAALNQMKFDIPSQESTAWPENRRPESQVRGIPDGIRGNIHDAGTWLQQNLDHPMGGTWFEGLGDYMTDMAEGQEKTLPEQYWSGLMATLDLAP